MTKLLGALRSKTVWFSLLLAVLSVVQMNLGVFTPLFTDPAHIGYFTLAVSASVAVLRWVTTLPLEQK